MPCPQKLDFESRACNKHLRYVENLFKPFIYCYLSFNLIEAKRANPIRRTRSFQPSIIISDQISLNAVCIPWKDPSNERKRLYKVFDRIVDSAGTKTSTGHCLKGTAKVSDNAAMKSSLAAVITHKQATYKDPMIEQLAIEDGDDGDEKKRRRTTREKKELTDAQKQQQEFDKNMKENLSL